MSNTTAELECLVPAAHLAGEVLFPRRGRPLKDQTPLSSALAIRSITLNLPAYLVEQLHEIAQRELSSLSQVVRTALLTELRRHGLGQPPVGSMGQWRGAKGAEPADSTL
jgi:hypothetical protein